MEAWRTDRPLNITPMVKYVVKTKKGVDLAFYGGNGKWFSVYKKNYQLKTVSGWQFLPKP